MAPSDLIGTWTYEDPKSNLTLKVVVTVPTRSRVAERPEIRWEEGRTYGTLPEIGPDVYEGSMKSRKTGEWVRDVRVRGNGRNGCLKVAIRLNSAGDIDTDDWLAEILAQKVLAPSGGRCLPLQMPSGDSLSPDEVDCGIHVNEKKAMIKAGSSDSITPHGGRLGRGFTTFSADSCATYGSRGDGSERRGLLQRAASKISNTKLYRRCVSFKSEPEVQAFTVTNTEASTLTRPPFETEFAEFDEDSDCAQEEPEKKLPRWRRSKPVRMAEQMLLRMLVVAHGISGAVAASSTSLITR